MHYLTGSPSRQDVRNRLVGLQRAPHEAAKEALTRRGAVKGESDTPQTRTTNQRTLASGFVGHLRSQATTPQRAGQRGGRVGRVWEGVVRGWEGAGGGRRVWLGLVGLQRAPYEAANEAPTRRGTVKGGSDSPQTRTTNQRTLASGFVGPLRSQATKPQRAGQGGGMAGYVGRGRCRDRGGEGEKGGAETV